MYLYPDINNSFWEKVLIEVDGLRRQVRGEEDRGDGADGAIDDRAKEASTWPNILSSLINSFQLQIAEFLV